MRAGHTVRNTQEKKSHVWKDSEVDRETGRMRVMPAYVPIWDIPKHLKGLNPSSYTQA